MKQLLACLLLAAAPSAFAAEAEWLTDVHVALDKAAAQHKYVMLDFTGSDWCGWCKKLKAEVFDQSEFIAFAKENLVLVEVDFPHQKQLSAAQQEANNALARTYEIRGYPTIIFIDSMSRKVGQAGYMAGGPKTFIANLEKIPGMKHVDGAVKDSEPEAPRRPPAFVPIAPAQPNYYAELALKGISGSPASRMALINNETFMAGDTAKVKVRDTRVEVVCKEIREDSVLITVDGKPCELKLGVKSSQAKSTATAQK
jgi:protein disulfide-isomerase